MGSGLGVAFVLTLTIVCSAPFLPVISMNAVF
jgi:hypothetical protein